MSLTRELSSIYPMKERNAALKAFKEEKHKLQNLDLVEMMTESSLFGEYTVLKLTDKGKELYFGEDAELFMEKPDRKELILSRDIKEKRLFFPGGSRSSCAWWAILCRSRIISPWWRGSRRRGWQRE